MKSFKLLIYKLLESIMQYNMILENVENLPLNIQIQLVETLKKRIVEKKREIIYNSAKDSLSDYQNGVLIEETADELIERLSWT